MLEEVAAHIKSNLQNVNTVGILSTTGTLTSNVYPECLARFGLRGIQVSEEFQNSRVQPAIYDAEYGIKAQTNPVTAKARNQLAEGVDHLAGLGAEVVVLGCTEIPLALTEDKIAGTLLIDPAWILAGALIRESARDSLK